VHVGFTYIAYRRSGVVVVEKRSYPRLKSVVTLDLGRPSYLTPCESHYYKTGTVQLAISRRVCRYSL